MVALEEAVVKHLPSFDESCCVGPAPFCVFVRPFFQTARVLVTNDGAIPTTFTIEDAENKATQSRPQGPDVPSRPFTTDPAISSVAGDDSSNSVLTHGEAASGDKRRKIRTAESASSAPALVDNVHGHTHHEMLPTAQRSGGSQEAKSRAGNSFPTKAASASLPATEEELLARAAAVGDAVLQHPKGRTAIDVEAGGEEGLGGRRGEGGGSIAAYGSSEIVVTFSPLTVGNFCAVKVGITLWLVEIVRLIQLCLYLYLYLYLYLHLYLYFSIYIYIYI